jgi:uncharacterized protein involved in exopolysaccharide biosynthesis
VDISPGLQVLMRYWRIIVLAGVLAAVVAYGASYLFTPSYSATGRVLVRARETRFLTSTGQDLKSQPGALDSNLVKSLTQTNSSLIKGRSVAEEIVRELQLDRARPVDESILGRIRSFAKQVRGVVTAYVRYGFYQEPASPFDAAVGEVIENLQVNPIKDSYLIEVKASADDPRLAAAIADAAARALVRVSEERFAQDAATHRDFLKGQVDSARAEVSRLQTAIRSYKEKQGIVDVTEELKLNAGSNESLRIDLRGAEAELAAARAQFDVLDERLRSQSATEASTSTIQTGRSSTTTSSTSPNRVYQELLVKRAEVEAQIASLDAKTTALRADLQARANVLPEQEATLSEFERELDAASETFRYVKTTYDMANINSEEGAVEVSLTDHASIPLYPERPVRYLFALLGMVLGLLAGFGLAYYVDRRRSPSTPPGDAVAAMPPLVSGPLPQPAYAAATRVSAPLTDRPNDPLLNTPRDRRAATEDGSSSSESRPNGRDLDALKVGAAMMTQAGNRVAALALLWSAVAIDPRDLTAHRRLAATLACAGDVDAAADEYARYIEFMLPIGEIGRARMELNYGASILGGHPALRAAAEKLRTEVEAILSRTTAAIVAPTIAPATPTFAHAASLGVTETRLCIRMVPGQGGRARVVDSDSRSVAWVVVDAASDVIASIDTSKPSPYGLRANVADVERLH